MIAGFAVIAALMLWNTGLSVYHAGVEWKFWPGPIDCSRADQQPRVGDRYAEAAPKHQNCAL